LRGGPHRWQKNEGEDAWRVHRVHVRERGKRTRLRRNANAGVGFGFDVGFNVGFDVGFNVGFNVVLDLDLIAKLAGERGLRRRGGAWNSSVSDAGKGR